MSRESYDRAADDWRRVADAARRAGGSDVALPVGHLQLILHGYEQLQAERAAALEVLGGWHRQGLLDTTAVLGMQRALGVISQETYDYEMSAAQGRPGGASTDRFFVDTTREGCVDHIPVADGACRECAQAQGVTL
ncbi:hypothetical protein [Streptosporangium canum]|uniref:hypothetical protein n=1 Tax=Streptosporangium canum TaxID=324952 RepID=UPI0033ADFF4F